jgi:hypothetical protein
MKIYPPPDVMRPVLTTPATSVILEVEYITFPAVSLQFASIQRILLPGE